MVVEVEEVMIMMMMMKMIMMIIIIITLGHQLDWTTLINEDVFIYSPTV